jgi:serine/threonine protein kinase
MKGTYHRLSSLLPRSKQKGGTCFGEGTFGRVCALDELKDIDKITIISNQNGNEISEQLTLAEFVNHYDKLVVYKIFKDTYNPPDEANIELEKMELVLKSNAPHSILCTMSGKTLLYFRVGNDTNTKYLLFKRIDGDMKAFIKLPELSSNSKIQLIKQCEQQTVEFLHAIHNANTLHCDIKPANILYKHNEDGTYSFAVGDYGLVTDIYICGNGTPLYTSPIANMHCHNADLWYETFFNDAQFINIKIYHKKLLDEFNEQYSSKTPTT